MAETAKAFETNPFTVLTDPRAFWGVGLQQVQAGLKAQADLLANLQSVTETCLRHRRQNIEDAATAVGRMCECHDLVEAAVIQQKWLTDCMQSLAEDFTALQNTTAAAARDLPAAPSDPARDIKVARKVPA